jgi:hypothetical protein
MKLKQIFLVFAVFFLVIAGCADDSSDDDSSGGTTWTEIFNDSFDRSSDPSYSAGATDTLGADYRVWADDAVGGTIQITSNEVACVTNARAEYQTPLTVADVKLTVKFSSSAFANNQFDGISLLDAITAPAGCQVSVGYYSDGADYAFYVLDKDEPDPANNHLATAAVTLTANTEYTMEMAIDDGTVTGTIKSSAGTTLATATASAASTSNKYVDCLMQEPSFSMDLTGTVNFDDFTIYTGD